MTVTKNIKKKSQLISAEELDKKFDAGDDMSAHIDWDEAQRFINVPFPTWMIGAMDSEAKRLGINRQALIKVWIADCIERHTRRASGT